MSAGCFHRYTADWGWYGDVSVHPCGDALDQMQGDKYVQPPGIAHRRPAGRNEAGTPPVRQAQGYRPPTAVWGNRSALAGGRTVAKRDTCSIGQSSTPRSSSNSSTKINTNPLQKANAFSPPQPLQANPSSICRLLFFFSFLRLSSLPASCKTLIPLHFPFPTWTRHNAGQADPRRSGVNRRRRLC